MTVQITQHTPNFSTAPQISCDDMAAIAASGFHTVINNRPDGEGGPEQPSSHDMAQAPGPVLAFCRSGTRSTNMWRMGQ